MTGTVRKATIEEARECWEGVPKASARKVAKALEDKGLEIGWRTVAKWKASGWGKVTKALEMLAEPQKTEVTVSSVVGSITDFNESAIAHITEATLRKAATALAVCADAIAGAPKEVLVAASGDISALLKVVIDGTKTISDVQMRVTDLRSRGATNVTPSENGALNGEILPPLAEDHPLHDFIKSVETDEEAHA